MDSSSPYKSGPWYQIMKLKDDISSYGITLPSIFKRKIGNGRTTHFWTDPWLGGPRLCDTFSRLYRLESNLECSVYDRAPVHHANINVLGRGSLNPVSHLHPPNLMFLWAWTRQPRSVVEKQELHELTNLLSSLYLSNDIIDTWECSISNDRLFTIPHQDFVLDEDDFDFEEGLFVCWVDVFDDEMMKMILMDVLILEMNCGDDGTVKEKQIGDELW
ncbi:RNA-directed DNA polymerase, eukaryota, Reverse transcriptase zinc-binding domain protein [Artemisia annua]|uniref:RNA-directed DNA polymerase, eukaryota, Reverse transcriptase zinc-binding domain protein n=1 Tax=Artemisia annua TaxID=35608 RepID=A0A2U1MNU6_ARTAN|nr:RNA-directed DNA polymerase, eukaryota, Reverse transcriptase zinc-binding domain protein [Artemisia annua]